jgi:small multidrug resistance family-3 protein
MIGANGSPATVAVFAAAAVMEVAGDALIRKGMRGGGLALALAGVVVLAAYGVAVNLLALDFSRMLGAYVGLFALANVVAGRLVFGEQIPPSTWIGLAVILAGSAIVHFGRGG